MLVDAPILRWRNGAWEFPSGALLTGLIVAMVLSPTATWYAAAVASAVGVAAKYVCRTRSANVFNPAALGIVVVHYAFGAGQSWWGALGDVTPLAVVLLIATGVFITDRVNKLPLVLAYLGAYFLIFTVAAFLRDPARVAEIFRPPDVQAVLFFAFFILTDPPTSPVRYRGAADRGADRGGHERRGVRGPGRGALPARRRARRQRVGSVAPRAARRGIMIVSCLTFRACHRETSPCFVRFPGRRVLRSTALTARHAALRDLRPLRRRTR